MKKNKITKIFNPQLTKNQEDEIRSLYRNCVFMQNLIIKSPEPVEEVNIARYMGLSGLLPKQFAPKEYVASKAAHALMIKRKEIVYDEYYKQVWEMILPDKPILMYNPSTGERYIEIEGLGIVILGRIKAYTEEIHKVIICQNMLGSIIFKLLFIPDNWS